MKKNTEKATKKEFKVTTINDGDIFLTPLKGKIPNDFCEAVRTLQRPYIPICKDEYDKVFNKGNDYFKYKNLVVTFGNADLGWALMPLQDEYAQKILLKNK